MQANRGTYCFAVADHTSLLLSSPGLGAASPSLLALRRVFLTAALQMSNNISSATWALLVLSWVFVSLRCGVRIFLVKSFGFDDWLMLLSQVSTHHRQLHQASR